MSFGAKLGFLEPLGRKFFFAVRHIFAAKDAEPKHFFRGKLRFKSRVEIFSSRLCQPIAVIFLHLVVNDHHFKQNFYPKGTGTSSILTLG